MAHIHELIDYTAGVYIVHNNKVLIRLHDKIKRWIHVGGHVELNEDPVAAAIRECKEEVGLDVTIYSPKPLFVPKDEPHSRELVVPAHMNIHKYGETTHQHIDLIYYATSETDKVVPESPDDQWVWLTAEEVSAHPDMSDKIKHYALGALAALSS